MSDQVVVICSGQPGSSRDEYLEELKRKQDFFYYHLFDYIVEEAEKQGFTLNKLNILDFYDSNPDKLEALRSRALGKIIEEIGETGGVHIISTAYHFEWKGKSYTGLRDDEVQALEPSLFLVVIDDLVRVRERLKEDLQWGERYFSLLELAKWRREEIEGIYNLAHQFSPPKEFYLVARNNDVDFLRELVFSRHKRKVYLSYPMTGETTEFFERKHSFVGRLQPYFLIFDPSMVKDWNVVEAWRRVKNVARREKKEIPEEINVSVQYSDGLKNYTLRSWDIEMAIETIRAQVIHIDYRIIESCQYVIAYHPREHISAGVMSEIIQAKSIGKFVYAFYPYEPSPFFEWYPTKIFQKENEIVDFMVESIGKTISAF